MITSHWDSKPSYPISFAKERKKERERDRERVRERERARERKNSVNSTKPCHLQIRAGLLLFPFFPLGKKGNKNPPSHNIYLFKVSFPCEVIYRLLATCPALPGNYLLKEIVFLMESCSFNPRGLAFPEWRERRAAVSGNPPRGPPWRQHIPCQAAVSAAERAGCCRVNVQYHGACKCPVLLRAGRHSPGQTRRLRRFQRFCWKFGAGRPQREPVAIVF